MTDQLPTFFLSKGRLEALVDGIFAIAMTILVLEVKVPELREARSSPELAVALGRSWPTMAAYFFSFFMLGLYWVWHHRIAACIRELDKVLLACSLLFLALVSFFPFCTALLGRYPTNFGAVMLYLPVQGLILLSQTAFFGLARSRGRLHADFPPDQARNAHRLNLLSCALFFIAAAPAALRFGLAPTLATLALGGLLLGWRSRA